MLRTYFKEDIFFPKCFASRFFANSATRCLLDKNAVLDLIAFEKNVFQVLYCFSLGL